ncbi:uncharacterized protein [Henckelia pumila]|uniref:uncharacterized protein isoform X17 n=1 Tax=Henckelia pumila TaxID=405737 RepID=UPI003C6E425C
MHMMSSSSPNSRSEPPKSFRPCAELACPIIKLLVIKVRWLYRYLCKNRAKDSEKVWWLYRYLFKNKAKESGKMKFKRVLKRGEEKRGKEKREEKKKEKK